MRKIIVVFFIVCTLTMFTSCSVSETKEAFSELSLLRCDEGNMLHFFDLESLENHSEIAVVGTFTEDSTQKLSYRYEDIFGKTCK